jgi:hypothetical protein
LLAESQPGEQTKITGNKSIMALNFHDVKVESKKNGLLRFKFMVPPRFIVFIETLILARIIHDAWASTCRKLVSLGYCSKFVVSTGHPRREN